MEKNGGENLVLVGTYRPEDAAWIRERRLYNLPIAATSPMGSDPIDEKVLITRAGEAYGRFKSVVLFADDAPAMAFAATFREVVDGAWLKANSVAKTPHATRYALFALGEKLSAAKVLSDPTAEVWVCSTRWTGKIDAEFYSRPLPACGGKSIPNIFEKLRPYFRKWKSAQAFNPVQMEFFEMMPLSTNVSRHLDAVGRVNLGSFYTPARYVRLVGDWLLKHGVGNGWTVADLSCGYGAFFALGEIDGLRDCRYVGNDIDAKAVAQAKSCFPNVQMSVENALADVARPKLGIGEDEKLVIVGNPPYNDMTSQANQNIKTNAVSIDADIRTRDLGMSSILAYDKLRADFVAVLHPLSYLIKKANFAATRRFFANYTLLEHVVFPSSEFAGTSKASSFPVIVAFYRRTPARGLTFDAVRQIRFQTTTGETFSLDGFDYVTDEIVKYPGGRRYDPEILFYTMRDINALKRSRTFIRERISNAVDVNPAKLAHYCYVDCFKRYANIPYYLGNFNVPFIRDEFASVSKDVVALAKAAHPDIFGVSEKTDAKAEERIQEYVQKSLRGRK